jgi:DNA-binding NarL/FixJ family response regulator
VSGSDGVSDKVIRLLIADDHPVVRDGLRGLFAGDPEFEVVGEAGDGAEAVRLTEQLGPDVVLMDLRMPGTDGVTAIRDLAARGSSARVLVLTTYDTDSHVLPAIEAGASGYLLKDAPRDDLLRAVRATARGEAVLAPSVAALLMSRVRGAESGSPHAANATQAAHPAHAAAAGDGPAGPLSAREVEVLQLVASGATNREAAAKLFITEATVKSHLLNIYAKLGVSDRAAAVSEAFHRGLLQPQRRP